MTEAGASAADRPSQLLESLRGVASSHEFRLFAVACCRRIEPHLPEAGRAAVQVAEDFANGRADDESRTKAAAALHLCCIYVDGDSSPEDRLQGFAAEAALNCVFGDTDYPPIPTYAATCAIAAAGAVVEVVIAECELQGESGASWQKQAALEERWQCAAIRERFGKYIGT